MKLKDRVLWEKITDSYVQGWDRVVLRLTENLADLTEKRINDGESFNASLEKSFPEAVKSSRISLDKKELSRKLIYESVELLILYWEYGKNLQKWLRKTSDIFLLFIQ